MTGKELICYILLNDLENVELPWFITIEEAAVKKNVGVETIKLWFKLGKLPGVKIGETIYIIDYEKVRVK